MQTIFNSGSAIEVFPGKVGNPLPGFVLKVNNGRISFEEFLVHVLYLLSLYKPGLIG